MKVEIKYAQATETCPALVLQIIRLDKSYMLWIGSTALEEANKEAAVLAGRLAADWACAMPLGNETAATPLFRSARGDASLFVAQRLARRFKVQIFLSIDAGDSNPLVMLEMEKQLVAALKAAASTE